MIKIFDTFINRSKAKDKGYKKGRKDQLISDRKEIARWRKEARSEKRKYLALERKLNKNYCEAIDEVMIIKDRAINDLNYHRALMEREKAIIREVLQRSKDITESSGALFDYFVRLENRKNSVQVNDIDLVDSKLRIMQAKKIGGSK